jgi:hypothetical protein
VRQLASPGSVEEFGQVVVCRSIPIIVVDAAAPASDAPLCWTSTRCARLRKARAPTTFCPLIPRLVDATAYVARAAERHVCAASSKCYGSQTVESGKAIRPGMTGFPRRIFVSQCSADVSTYRCRSVVIFSSVAKPSDRTCSISLTKKPQLPRIAQALIDALRARGAPRAFANPGAGARGRRRV